MAKIIITKQLVKEIKKKFTNIQDIKKILALFDSLKKQPKKSKNLAHIGGIVIKEIKFQKYRFYFITDRHILKFGSEDELANLLIKFVKMSEKKDQQKTINEIKKVLQSMNFEGF